MTSHRWSSPHTKSSRTFRISLKKSNWHLLIDEEMQVLRYRSHRIPKTHRLITDHIDLEPYNAIYRRVAVRDRSSLEESANNKDRDEILEILADTIRTLTNRYWKTYVNTEQYERLRRGEVKRLAFQPDFNAPEFNRVETTRHSSAIPD